MRHQFQFANHRNNFYNMYQLLLIVINNIRKHSRCVTNLRNIIRVSVPEDTHFFGGVTPQKQKVWSLYQVNNTFLWWASGLIKWKRMNVLDNCNNRSVNEKSIISSVFLTWTIKHAFDKEIDCFNFVVRIKINLKEILQVPRKHCTI